MDSLRLEMREFGVSVSLVEPGYIKTPISEKANIDAEVVTEEQHQLYSRFWSTVTESRI